MKKLVVIVILFLLCGCATRNDIVLTKGTEPYQLPSGEYIDTKGKTHIEEDKRWSLSEADLFQDTQEIEKKKPSMDRQDMIQYGCIVIIALLLVKEVFTKKKE